MTAQQGSSQNPVYSSNMDTENRLFLTVFGTFPHQISRGRGTLPVPLGARLPCTARLHFPCICR
jgi:hypothetical protein